MGFIINLEANIKIEIESTNFKHLFFQFLSAMKTLFGYPRNLGQNFEPYKEYKVI